MTAKIEDVPGVIYPEEHMTHMFFCQHPDFSKDDLGLNAQVAARYRKTKVKDRLPKPETNNPQPGTNHD